MAAINRPFPGRRPLPIPRVSSPINGWLLAALTFAALCAMLPVLQNSNTTSNGFRLQEIQAEQATLRGEIGLIESDVARLTSLARVKRRAAEIGLGPAQEPIYVTVTEAGPAPANIPAEYLPPLNQQQPATDPWWASLMQWLPLPE